MVHRGTIFCYFANNFIRLYLMRHIRFSVLLPVGVAVALFCQSCSTCSRQQQEEINVDLADLAVDSNYINMAQKVFYALPTPIEVSMLIKNSGIAFQPALLNDPGNVSRYLTTGKMALNFGIYVTDLTYAGLFEQTQIVLRYKQAIQQLTEGLGIQSAIDNKTLQQLEANINNREELLRIISDAYASCTAYLNEEDRHFLTLAILAGGWVEGMYIATGMTDEKLASTEGRMRQLVIDQKLTFDLMWEAMSNMKSNADIAVLMSDMSDLAQVFDRINIDQTPNTVAYSESEKTNKISSASLDNVTAELYAEIKNRIQILRHNFTKK